LRYWFLLNLALVAADWQIDDALGTLGRHSDVACFADDGEAQKSGPVSELRHKPAV
jgi:hypothetical protein